MILASWFSVWVAGELAFTENEHWLAVGLGQAFRRAKLPQDPKLGWGDCSWRPWRELHSMGFAMYGIRARWQAAAAPSAASAGSG